MNNTDPVAAALATTTQRRAIRALLKDVPALVEADADLMEKIAELAEAISGTVLRVARETGAGEPDGATIDETMSQAESQVRTLVYGILGGELDAIKRRIGRTPAFAGECAQCAQCGGQGYHYPCSTLASR